MSTQVTVTLPDDTYRQAEYLARLTGREVADVLAETISLSLHPLGPQYVSEKAVAELADGDVLAAADALMDPDKERRFSELLEKQQAGQLTNEERTSLLTLMQVYQDGLLRKAQALNEAVRRGLRSPLQS